MNKRIAFGLVMLLITASVLAFRGPPVTCQMNRFARLRAHMVLEQKALLQLHHYLNRVLHYSGRVETTGVGCQLATAGTRDCP